jgi:hypothetical protein
MRKFLISTVAAAGLALAAAQAHATVFTLDHFDVVAHTTDSSGLQIGIDKIQTTPLTFDLGATNPQKFSLFTIYTPESSVNDGEDTVLQDITVDFFFSSPTPNSVDPLHGTTNGEIENVLKFRGHIIFDTQAGTLDWDNSGVTNMNFGNGLTGLMTIKLNDGDFNESILGLNNHNAPKHGLTVKGTFDWVNDPTGVPEPATWALMIGGFGMAGGMLRRRKAATVSA